MHARHLTESLTRRAHVQSFQAMQAAMTAGTPFTLYNAKHHDQPRR